MSTTFKPEKMNFTEGEVAQQLGISVERLHQLLDLNVFNDGGEKPPRITFRPQDLVMLGIWDKVNKRFDEIVDQPGTAQDERRLPCRTRVRTWLPGQP